MSNKGISGKIIQWLLQQPRATTLKSALPAIDKAAMAAASGDSRQRKQSETESEMDFDDLDMNSEGKVAQNDTGDAAVLQGQFSRLVMIRLAKKAWLGQGRRNHHHHPRIVAAVHTPRKTPRSACFRPSIVKFLGAMFGRTAAAASRPRNSSFRNSLRRCSFRGSCSENKVWDGTGYTSYKQVVAVH